RGFAVAAVAVKDVVVVLELVEHRPAVYVLDGVQPEFKRRHDAIVAATAADRPEEVLVFSRAGDEKFPVGRHHVRRNKVVEGQSEPTREVADAASEGQAADARGRDDAAGAGKSERIRRGVEIAPCRAAFGASGPLFRIDTNSTHAANVDDQAFVDGAESRDAVGTPSNGKFPFAVASEVDGGDDSSRIHRASVHSRG